MPKLRRTCLSLLSLCAVLASLWGICPSQSPAQSASGQQFPPEVQRLNQEAEKLAEQGRYAQAIPLARQALEATDKALGPNHLLSAEAAENLAEILRNAGEFAKAEPLHRRALAIRQQTLGPAHLDTAKSLGNLAVLYDAMGDYRKAEPLHRQALGIREKLLGPAHADVAQSLNNLALSLRAAGASDKAAPLLARAVGIIEKAKGPLHEDLATCLNSLGMVEFDLGQNARAEANLKRALTIREKALPPDHPDTATTLNNLGVLYDTMGDAARAEPLARRALAMREKVLGPEHPDTAESYNNLAELYSGLGQYAKAEPYYRRALGVMEKMNGPEHPDTATVLDNFAGMYRASGDYAKAEPLLRRSLAIRKKANGAEHPDVAASLASLADLNEDQGNYPQAETLAKQALALREKTLGPEHPDTAQSLNAMGRLYTLMGDYARAEALYKRALAVWEKAFGPEHIAVGMVANNMGMLYLNMGDYTRSEPLLLRALAIREAKLGPSHRDTATTLNNLGLLYREQKLYAKAEPFYRRALAIKEQLLGPEHPSTGVGLNNLGDLYLSQGDFARALPLYQRALVINEKTFGPQHPSTATLLNNLAVLHKKTGNYAQAELLYNRALSIREKTLGPKHSEVAGILNNLAGLSVAKGDYLKALDFAKRAQGITADLLDQVLAFTSEDQKLAFLESRRWEMDAFLSLVAQRLPGRPDAARTAYDVWLKRKGVVLDSQRQAQEALVNSGSPQAKAAMQELGAVRAELSRLAFSTPAKIDGGAAMRKMAELERRKAELQALLSQQSQAFALDLKKRRGDTAQVAAALPTGSVLVDLARVRTPVQNPKVRGTEDFSDHYVAFVLPAGRPDAVSLTDLGAAGPIDEAVAAYKRAILDNKPEALPQPAQALFRRAFEPLAARLGQAAQIFLSPDGALSLIPFETFQKPDGRYLIEDYTFSYLAAGRDLLGFGPRQNASGKALVMGDPDFDLDASDQAKALASLSIPAISAKGKRSADMGAMRFDRLPATKDEAQAVQALLGTSQAELYTGQQAQEGVLTAAKSPRVLHLATHAFFLPQQDAPPRQGQQNAGRKAENPLLRSGLVLAGANRALKGEQGASGVVTAEKVLGLTLQGTELVVLSACSTGEGEVQLGEGVYGLQRAFSQAGAQSLVMSMWPVPDVETKELMVAFYGNLKAGQDRAQALRSAMLQEMRTARARYKNASPLFWGAFVFLGDPGKR